jgi:hypothetical protein
MSYVLLVCIGCAGAAFLCGTVLRSVFNIFIADGNVVAVRRIKKYRKGYFLTYCTWSDLLYFARKK